MKQPGGQAKAHEVEVEAGDHLYACPLDPSPDHRLAQGLIPRTHEIGARRDGCHG